MKPERAAQNESAHVAVNGFGHIIGEAVRSHLPRATCISVVRCGTICSHLVRTTVSNNL